MTIHLACECSSAPARYHGQACMNMNCSSLRQERERESFSSSSANYEVSCKSYWIATATTHKTYDAYLPALPIECDVMRFCVAQEQEVPTIRIE